MKLSETHLSYLKMFGPDSYGINLPYSIAKTLEIKGLVEWVPPKFETQLWAITAKGKEALKTAEGSGMSDLLQDLRDLRTQAPNDHVATTIGNAIREIERLQKGITDYLHGDYPRVAKVEKCHHGRYGYEGCETCIDEYFDQLLAEVALKRPKGKV